LAPLLAIHPSGDIIVVVDSLNSNLVLIDLQMGKIIENLSGHSSQISSIGFDQTGQALWSSSWDGTIRIWNFLDPSSRVQILRHKAEVTCACIRPDGRELAAASVEGNIYFWSLVDQDEADPGEGKLLRIIETRSDLSPIARKGSSLIGTEGSISNISYSLDGSILFVLGSFPFIALYDSEFGIFLKRIELTSKKSTKQENLGLNLKISCDGQTLSVLTNSSIYLFKSQKSNFHFDPMNLDIETTPLEVSKMLGQGLYGKALSLAFQLNIEDLSLKVWNDIPLEIVESIISLASPKVYENTLILLSRNFQNISRIEAILQWVYVIIKCHGIKIKESQNLHLKGALKSLGKYIQDYYVEVRDNSYSFFNLISYFEFFKLNPEN
jgi:periodic tryptophan protein 2